MRLLFSDCAHRMKRYCCTTGPALVLLVKVGQLLLSTFEMVTMEETKSDFRDLETQLARLFPQRVPPTACLSELGVVHMFPSLPTRAVFQAVKAICCTIMTLKKKLTEGPLVKKSGKRYMQRLHQCA